MSTRTVLLVEDNPSTRKLYTLALEHAGYRVVAAPDAKTALELAAREVPDLILQDMVLPDMDGFELYGALRALPRGAEIPILACSGFLSTQEEIRAAALGFTDLLVKPLEPSRLVEIVGRLLPVAGAAPAGEAAKPGGGKRVLVVDDDAIQRKLLTIHLERLGFDVSTCADGDDALEHAAEETPDAILSDVMMPRLNGLGLCQAVRQDPSLAKVPVILFSASYAEEPDLLLARNVGATALVVRTPDFKAVIDALVRSLGTLAPVESGAAPPPGAAPERGRDLPTPRKNPGPEPTHRFIQHLERQVATGSSLVRQCSLQGAGLSVLATIADALARNQDLDSALQDALSACLEAGGFSRGAVFLLSERNELALRAHSGHPEAARRELARYFGAKHLLERALETATTIALPRDRDREEREVLGAQGAASALVVPLVLHAERLGVLALSSSARDLTDADWLSFARAVAGQLAQAVGLARTFARLARSERRYRSLLDQADDAILALDPRGKVLEVNRRAQEMLGRPAAEVVGRPLEELLASEGDTAARVRDLLLDGTRLGGVRLARPDSWRVYVDVQAARVYASGEEVILAIARDVSERRRLEEAQARLLARADEAVRTRDEFLNTASQELKNPASTLELQVDAVLRAAADDAPVAVLRPRLETIRANARKLAGTVETLCDATRIAGGKLVLAPGQTDLAELARGVVERLGSDLERAGCSATVRAPEAVTGFWDRARLEQVLGQLLSNALKFAPGTPVEVAVEATSGGARLTVTDHGTGIAPDLQGELFERVKSVRPGRSGPGGLGLGLWLVRQIAEAHGGSVSVVSRPGKGSAFTVELPGRAPA